jgi:hypothetical protein
MRILTAILAFFLASSAVYAEEIVYQKDLDRWFITGHVSSEGDKWCEAVTYQPKQISETKIHHSEYGTTLEIYYDWWDIPVGGYGKAVVTFDGRPFGYEYYKTVDPDKAIMSIDDEALFFSQFDKSNLMTVEIEDSEDMLTINLEESHEAISAIKECVQSLTK